MDGTARDGTAPTVTRLELAGVPPAPQAGAGLYRAGEAIEVAVTFSEPVTVSGPPQLALTVGWSTRQADYRSGGGTPTLRFRYTVGAADRDSDGLTVAASALTRNAGLIRDLANNAAALELGAHAVRNDPDFRLNGGARDTRRPKAVLVTPTGIPSGAGGVFIAGDVIVWEVRFDEPVRKTIARPDLQIQMPTSGSPVRRAPYLSGSDTALFRFRQVVQSADRYAGGRIRLGVSSANFTDRANNQPQIFGNEDQALAGFRVNGGAADARGPAVTGLTLAGEGRGPDGVFLAGDVIEATVAFDEAAAVTGTPQLEIGIGSAARRANYHSGSETTSLVFRYAVAAGDSDPDGISVPASALGLNGGTIRDAAGNDAALGLGAHAAADAAGFAVAGNLADRVAPTVTGVALSAAAPAPQGAGGVFVAGDGIRATLTLQRGSDRYRDAAGGASEIGAATRQAAYVSGSETRSLVFRYTVASGDSDANGVSVPASALGLAGGTIRDAAGNAAALGLGTRAITDDPGFPVDAAAADEVGPTVVGVALSGDGQGPGGDFLAGDEIAATVDFDEPVTVTGTPELALVGLLSPAAYASGSGTRSLVFRAAVSASDEDADGVSVPASALSLAGGTIRDDAGNDAALGLGTRRLDDDPDFTVDGDGVDVVAPSVVAVTVGGAASGPQGVFIAGDAIEVTVEFSEPVAVLRAPRLALEIGAGTRHAGYASGSGTASLVFRYTVAAPDSDPDGISIGASALSLNGGNIVDRSALAHPAALGLGRHAITDGGAAVAHDATEAVAPTVTGVTISGRKQGVQGGYFVGGDEIRVTVEFSETVTVTGTPQLALTIGANTRQADLLSGSGTTALVFGYTVVSADHDPNGISVGASALALNGGTIRDANGNAAALGLGTRAVTDDGAALVAGNFPDALGPAVTGVSLAGAAEGANGVFIAGDEIEVTVEFDEAATVTGTPQVALTIWSAVRQAGYVLRQRDDFAGLPPTPWPPATRTPTGSASGPRRSP